MPTTTYSGLRYPASTSAVNVPLDIQNLATDLDQKVTVRVATNTDRNALTKTDQMLVQVTSTRRTFRWDATNSRWDYVAGPWYTWSPSLVAVGGAAVTGATSTRGEYVIAEGVLRFRADFAFGAAIDGKTGSLSLQLPTSVVSATAAPAQASVIAHLYTAASNRHWVGQANVSASTNLAVLVFPFSTSDASMGVFVNATSAGATGTGTPLVPGSYPLTNGSALNVWGEISLSSWPAL